MHASILHIHLIPNTSSSSVINEPSNRIQSLVQDLNLKRNKIIAHANVLSCLYDSVNWKLFLLLKVANKTYFLGFISIFKLHLWRYQLNPIFTIAFATTFANKIYIFGVT